MFEDTRLTEFVLQDGKWMHLEYIEPFHGDGYVSRERWMACIYDVTAVYDSDHLPIVCTEYDRMEAIEGALFDDDDSPLWIAE